MIYIQVLNRYWDAGSKLSEKNGWSEDDTLKFHEYLANEFKNLIVKAIDDQRYRNKWPALTLGYLNYKKKHGYPTNIWELTGELKKSLAVVHKRRKVYEVKFPDKIHSDTSLKLVELAKILEFGTIKNPPRPLFRQVYRYMSSNISYFMKKYENQSNKKRSNQK